MTSREFCYWLQGHFEIQGSDRGTGLTGAQTDMIRRHLALVFKHEIDPSYPEQEALNKIHAGDAMPHYDNGDDNKIVRC